ncbi:hypothetical protein QT998_19985 [Microcoleus sp. S1D4]
MPCPYNNHLGLLYIIPMLPDLMSLARRKKEVSRAKYTALCCYK